MLNIALPKGRLGDKVYDMLAAAGYDCPGYYEQNRKLVFESPEKNVRYLLVKPSDVAILAQNFFLFFVWKSFFVATNILAAG